MKLEIEAAKRCMAIMALSVAPSETAAMATTATAMSPTAIEV
jgi:hypothetical protein